MKGVLKDGPAAGQAFEVGDPPIRRGMIVLGEAAFGEHGHRYYLSAGLTMLTYGHVIDELEDAPRIKAEDAIMAARRGEDVRTQFG